MLTYPAKTEAKMCSGAFSSTSLLGNAQYSCNIQNVGAEGRMGGRRSLLSAVGPILAPTSSDLSLQLAGLGVRFGDFEMRKPQSGGFAAVLDGLRCGFRAAWPKTWPSLGLGLFMTNLCNRWATLGCFFLGGGGYFSEIWWR